MKIRTAMTMLIILVASLSARQTVAQGSEEVCQPCQQQVSVTGDFEHRATAATVAIDGVGERPEAFHDEVAGAEFTITIKNLPEGKYSYSIGEVETQYDAAGQRLFDLTVAENPTITGIDIFEKAGGARKVTYLTGDVDHLDDSLRGPLRFVFKGTKNTAKFNTFELKNADGAVVVTFTSGEMAEPFRGDATKVPEVTEPAIWRDPSKPLEARIHDLMRRMSLQEKVAQIQNDAPAIQRLGLPAYNYWNEALHGVANNGNATVFPEPIGAASSWNPEIFKEEGHIIGIEGRAKFNDYANKNNGNSKWWTGLTFWTPNVNIFRDPRWGRGQETYGEDPFLSGEIGVQFVQGMQGDDPKYMLSMACAKHYAVHSGPEPDRHRFDAVPSERDLYETYLPQFERVVREGKVGGVMSSYNAVFGIPVSASKLLLQDILRDKWGFEGYVVSDCGAVGDIWQPRAHGYVKTAEEAAALAVKAGTDLCCGGDYNALVKAVQAGKVTEKDVDNALYYTLWTRFRLGLFDPVDQVPFNKITLADNDTPEHEQVALKVARQSMVLLKNDGILPLDIKKYKKIAVIGPNGDSKSMLEGNYHGSASRPVSILAGIKKIVGSDAEVTFALGSPVTTQRGGAAWSNQDNTTNRPIDELKAEALEQAKAADLIIYVGGITPQQEGEGFDRRSIELPEVQDTLIKALHETGKPMVMVNCSGSAMALTWEDENLPAILQAWYPGEQGGTAVAEVLFGKTNPSGHLPVTFYRATSDLPAFTDYSMKNRTYRYFEGKPLYAFGHGLSYTKFDYSDAKLASKTIAPDGTAKLSFTIKNAGDMDGTDVAQVYYRHIDSKVPQPIKSLCGFARVSVDKGGTQTVEIDIPASRLRYWDVDSHQYVVEKGDYELQIGSASDDIRLKVPMTVGS